VTLGRLRDLRGAPTVGRVLEGCGTLGDEVAVDAVVLMRSDLLPTGARYSVLARVPLGSAAR
jgi:2'-5' RNA ligase